MVLIVQMANIQRESEVLGLLQRTAVDGNVLTRWSQSLPVIQCVFNTSFNSTIGTSPARILFGDQISRKINHGIYEPETKI